LFASARSCVAGKGKAQNDAEVIKWFRKAPERGFGGAQDNLAIAYVLGKCVPKVWLKPANGLRRPPRMATQKRR
jgi:TPR repeat protein